MSSAMEQADKQTLVGASVTWGGWLLSHLPEINSFLQSALLIVGLIGGIYTILNSRMKRAILKKDFTDTGTFKAYKK